MYCSICGSDLNVKEIKNEGGIPYCVTCDKLFFPKVTLAMISILVNSKNQICLVNQYHKKEYKVLLAGFVKPKETLETCVKREIMEEVGLPVYDTQYLNSYFYDGNQVLMVGFIAKTNEFEFTLDKEEIEFADWYEMDDCLHRIRTGSIAYNLVKEFISTRKV